IGGAWLQQPRLSIIALTLLLTALAVLMLRWRQPLTCGLWLLLALPLLAAIGSGHAALALDAVPLVVNVALAWLFGHTLAAGKQPLVARLICIIEDPQRLQLPGVARYARQLTLFWTLLLGAQALLLLVLALCVVPGGVLVSLGFDSPWPLAPTQVAWYTRIGTYLVPLLTMVLEYAWRRWYLRHIPHPGVRQFIARMIACWPQMLGRGGAPR
ncbi:MAG: xanthomonadin biosynthesis protein, partial [Xanthomonadales bacterium]|nr:xanthomonadin biosynthesis protein [Xanthomonadales bacterium]